MDRSLLAWLETVEAIVKQRQARRISSQGLDDFFELERADHWNRMERIIKKHLARERQEAELQQKRGDR